MTSLLHVPTQTMRDGLRIRMLCRNDEYEAGLVYYPAGTVHPPHEHARAQMSFVLGGGFMEESSGGETMPLGARHAYKPEGAKHRVNFGWCGALILSVDFRCGSPFGTAPTAWRPSSRVFAEGARLLFDRIAEPDTVIDDMIAATQLALKEGRASRCAPRWLRRAAEQIADDPHVEIAEIANSAGVHRVHLSRAFQRHFSMSPTQFRLQAKSALALRHLIELGCSPGEAAAAGGFADQAHWNRAARVSAGYLPGRLSQMMRH